MCDHHSLLALQSLTVAFLFLRHICFECAAKIPTGWKSEAIFASCFEQSYIYARLDVYQTV